MNKPVEFMKAHKIASDEVWEVRRGGAWAVKHAALERVAAECGIVFGEPKVLEARGTEQCAALVVTGKMGDRTEWSIGEAAPGNNKNAYPFAMAEKRAKDRVILKLLNAHGTVYSEAEADEFAETPKRQNPHVTQPRDVNDLEVRTDQNGELVDCIPVWKHRDVHKLKVADARPVAEVLLKVMRDCGTAEDLIKFGNENAREFAKLPDKWIDMYQGEYQSLLDDLRTKRKAA